MASGDIEKGKGDEIYSYIPVECTTKEEWENTFVAKVQRSNPPMLDSCCIFRVPEVLRRQKEVAYQPNIVSIGPFHRGGEKFHPLQNVKEWYLKCFLSRTNRELGSLISSISEREITTRARNCYAEPLNLGQTDFVEMLILDSCFLVELFRKAARPKDENRNDPIFNMACMLEYLYHDLLLLENQLPWFVLEFFYNLIENSSNSPLSQVVINFFKKSVADPGIFEYNTFISANHKIEHILDLIRSALVQKWEPQVPPKKKTRSSSSTDLNGINLPQRIPSVVTLSEAGVQFKKGKPGCILKITFKDGVFTIPPLAIDERTGSLFRNLMAYEQCYHECLHKITSYAVLMDNLIDTTKDVDLLCNEGIVGNWLSAEDACKFFNELYNDTTVIGYYYDELCKDVEEYHKALWNRWREKLKRDYFETPWATISFFAAFVLLVLTFLQTIYTIQPYYHPRH